jgi:hypothetical protein
MTAEREPSRFTNALFARRAIPFWAASIIASSTFPKDRPASATAADIDALRGELIALIKTDNGASKKQPF